MILLQSINKNFPLQVKKMLQYHCEVAHIHNFRKSSLKSGITDGFLL